MAIEAKLHKMLLSGYFITGICLNIGIVLTTISNKVKAAQCLIYIWMSLSFILLLSRSPLFPGWKIMIPTFGAIYGLMTIKYLLRSQSNDPKFRDKAAWLLKPNAQILCALLLALLNTVGFLALKGTLSL